MKLSREISRLLGKSTRSNSMLVYSKSNNNAERCFCRSVTGKRNGLRCKLNRSVSFIFFVNLRLLTVLYVQNSR